MPPTKRLTRDEQRAQTRADLLASAASIFAQRGFHGASVDEIAEAAGYTKGAVYSNFSSKEQLFLSLIDQHLEEAVDAIDEILSAADPEERASLIAERQEVMQAFDPEWTLLETEFVLYAARNEQVRERLAERQAEVRRTLAERIKRHFADFGVDVGNRAEDFARVIVALGDGLSLQQLVERDVDVRTLFVQMLEVTARGVASEG